MRDTVKELTDKGWELKGDGKLIHPQYAPDKPVTPLTAMLRDPRFGMEKEYD